MHVHSVKSTLYNACPWALCDSEIMSQAPMRMLLAGLGDMIAKYVSVCECASPTSSSGRNTARDCGA
jgi:glycerol dehydrogenase-like iron-containing ADH family enzyme